MREEILRELRSEYEQLRARNERETEKNILNAAEKCDGLKELLLERQNLIFGSLRGILNGKGSASDIPEQMLNVNERIGTLLEKNGLPRKILEPVYSCDICEDRGYAGEPVREMCSCMKKRYREKLREMMGLKNGNGGSFEHFNENLFSDEPLPGKNYSARALTKRIRDICRDWVEQYPRGDIRDLLFIGPSGLGKTFMMHAMAEKLIDKEVNVLIISAYRFYEIVRAAIFDNEEDALQELYKADVLFLDDLGAEPLTQNITIEQLYALLNERQLQGRSTVISTNLTIQEFRKRYTERITSRLEENGKSLVLNFMGDDLRKKEKNP